MYSDEELQSFVDRITPFKICQGEILEMLDVWFIKGYNKKPGFNIHNIYHNYDIIQTGLPRTKKDFHNMKNMIEFCGSSSLEFIKKYNTFKLWKKTENERLSFAYFGKIIPKFVKLLEKLGKDIIATSLIPKYTEYVINEIEPDYIDQDTSWNGIIKSGVTLQTLFKSRNFTKNEMTRALKLYGDYHSQHQLTYQNIANIKGYDLPDHWFNYIHHIEVLDWAVNKKAQLEKEKIIYGPAGQNMTLHYHTLLKHIFPNMLDQGPKTAWRKIITRLEEVQKKQIEDSLGSFVQFDIPNNIKDVIKNFPNITIIDSNQGLRQEGETMNHCVAGYVRSCITGKSIILHISLTNESTGEIGLKDGKYVIFQHYGKKNSIPSNENQKELENLIIKLNQIERR